MLPAIFARSIPGLVGAHLMRSDKVEDEEVEFTTVMWFESLDSVKNFMGEDYQRSHVPENAQASPVAIIGRGRCLRAVL